MFQEGPQELVFSLIYRSFHAETSEICDTSLVIFANGLIPGKHIILAKLWYLCYCYAGYGLFASGFIAVRKLFRKQEKEMINADLLPVTIIVTAYNEEDILEQKSSTSEA